jgi:hypothetical protein
MKLTTHLHLVQRVKCVELYLHSPYVFMAWCLAKYRDNVTFTFTHVAQIYAGELLTLPKSTTCTEKFATG